MKTLYIERSTGEVRSGDWVAKLDLEDVGRIVVGTGPGSFAGIRSAIAFAQGFAMGRKGVEVFGIPSPCAVAGSMGLEGRLAVVGDARQGKIWIALFDGRTLEKEVFQIESADLAETVPSDYRVVSPDDRRIGALLKETFGGRYLGERIPAEDGLRSYAEACPEALKPEPLPIYLNPAVRT